MLFIDFKYQLHQEENRLTHLALSTTKLLSSVLNTEDRLKDQFRIQRLLDTSHTQEERYLSLLISDASNHHVASVGKPFTLPTPLPKPQVSIIEQQKRRIISMQISNNNRHAIGYVFITLDKYELEKGFRQLLIKNISMVGLSLLLCAALALWVSRSISQPIREMTQTLKSLMSGHTSTTLAKNSLPEIQHLQSTLHEVSLEMQHAEANMRDSIQDAQAQLRYQARHDTLTGLVNRQELERRLQQALNDVKLHQSSHVFCYMDLDQFRVINDTCGHLAGDEMLRQISMILAQRIRTEDTFSRLGGDEFGLLLTYCKIEKAIEIANQLRQMVENFRFIHEGRMYQTGMSIGVVELAANMRDIGQITKHADAACYVAKEKGRNQVHVYDLFDDVLLKRHNEMEWVSKINEAIDYNDFILYCQGIFPLQDQSQYPFYEILIRKRDEFGGIILPAEFLPSAERYHLMTKIDRWAIQHTFIALQPVFHLQQPVSKFNLSINLSGTSVSDPTLLDFIKSAFLRYEIPPQHVCFEITETSAIINIDNTIRLITELQKIGTRFMLDDFGSGMSSFSYLKNLPVDFLKMDGAYVREITRNKVDFAMAKAIQSVAESMNIQTIAEYIEDLATLNALKTMGVNFGQGFYLNKPQPLAELLEKLTGSNLSTIAPSLDFKEFH